MLNSVAATDGVMAAAARSVGQEFLNGTISTGYLKNNTNPKYRRDGAVRAYRNIMSKYGPDNIDIRNSFYYYGVAKAHDFVKLMYRAGKNPTRASLMAATANMNWVNPYALPGVKIKTTKTDRFPISPGEGRSLQQRHVVGDQRPLQGPLNRSDRGTSTGPQLRPRRA